MASNMFIKFLGPDMNGGSTSKGHEGWIEVTSFNHGFTQPTTPTRSHGGGGTVEKAHHHPFTFTKILDSATDDLLKACWSGKHIEKMTFTAYRSAGDTAASQMGVPFLKVELESVIVTEFSIASRSADMPIETLALNYAKITYTYNGQEKMKGNTGADQPVSHDLTTHSVS
jgi:type VI secretion system secreted protein Hcp